MQRLGASVRAVAAVDLSGGPRLSRDPPDGGEDLDPVRGSWSACPLLSQAGRPSGLDLQLDGCRALLHRALAVGAPGGDREDCEALAAMASDPGVRPGARQDLVGAVLVDPQQAGPRVERLRALAVGVPDRDRALGE